MIELPQFFTPAFGFAITVTVLGGTLMGFTGFGSTLVMVPLITLVYGPTEAVAVGVAISAAGLAQMVPQASRDVVWKDVMPACLTSLVLVPVGTMFLFLTDPGITRRLIGGVVLLVAVIMLRGWSYNGPRNRITSSLCGAVSGFTNGFFGIGSPAVTFYYLHVGVAAVTARANIIITIGTLSVVTLVAMAIGGGFKQDTVIRAVVLFAPYSFSLWIGSKLFQYASDDLYRRIALWILMAMGMTVLVL